MIYARTICAALVLACLLAFAGGAALAQSEPDQVQLILSRPQSKASFRNSLPRGAYEAIKRRAGQANVHVLPMSRTEIWSVPKANATAVRSEAVRYGATVELMAATSGPAFKTASANVDMSERQRLAFEQAKTSLAAVGIKAMTVPPPAMIEYAMTKGASGSAPPSKMAIELKENEVVTITGKSVDKRDNLYVFRGSVDGTEAPATLMWWGDGKMVGTVQHAGHIYMFRHMGGTVYASVEMSMERMPQEHAPMSARMRSADPGLRDDPLVQQGEAGALRKVTTGMRAPAPPKAGAEKKVPAKGAAQGGEIVIDVMVAYTKKTAANYGDIKRELVDLAIEEGNEAFRNSGLGHIKLRLVHAYQTGYVEEGEHFDHVWRFADKGDGYMEEVHPLRDRHKADVAILIVDDPKGCGLATRVYADADEAFAVVHHDCAALTYSLAHEIGHIIGARHEPNIDKSTTPFPYGHGYVNGTKWRDIMSYRESCGGCARVPVWSSPKVLIRGEPAGTPEQDNARVIAEQAARVAAFR
jgi:hypothetical protein